MKNSGSKRIAQRYVKALFDIASSSSALDAVEKDMASLSKALKESRDFRHLLGNPLLSRENRAQIMTVVLEKMQAHKVTTLFIAMMARHRRLVILGEVAQLFAQTVASARGEMSAALTSATTLSPAEVSRVADCLSKAYGKKVTLDVRQDASLLGGVVVNVGSLRIDGSLAGKIRRLQHTLKVA